jgi:enolase-phosphatase E1
MTRVILTDIEGTTTPITFVKETLFPYVLNNVDRFLRDNWTLDSVQSSLQDLKAQVKFIFASENN